jgi:hypothetical protein
MEHWTSARAVTAGLAGTGVVAGAMALARRAGFTQLEFPRIIATALGRERRSTRTAGWALFAANGAMLPLGYRFGFRVLEAQGSVRLGAALGLGHGLLAAAAAALLSPLHPRAREAGLTSTCGRRPSNRSLAALAGVHVLYGAVLGASAARARRQ